MQTSGNAAPAFVTLLGAPVLHAAQAVPFAPERRFQLLAVLALHAGEWVERDWLAALFWADRENSEARRNLRKVLFKANEVAGVSGLDSRDHAVRWTVATDLHTLRTAIADQRGSEALAMLNRPLLAGIDDPANRAFAEWLASERSRLSALRHQLAVEHLPALDDESAVELARRMLDDDPLDEVAVAALMRTDLRRGQSTQAKRLYREYAARLAEELGVEPSNALRDLLRDAPATGLAARHEAKQSPVAPALAGFVGRRIELTELCALLARTDCRLLTVLGPGGIGKSRLVREALGRVGSDHPGGVHWIELQDLSDRAAVVARIAQALNIDISGNRDPLEQLLEKLPRQASLLVLDNAEHLHELPALVDRLIDAGTSLKLLLTSRARLGSSHEWLLPLGGLAVPEDDSRDPDAATAFDAVRLFAERARLTQREFDLVQHLPAVIAIVEAVQGMPLAIEMAASWIRLLPPVEIARDLQTSIDVLAQDPQTALAPARPEHASLRTVLERSWDLLAPLERQALADLSVFRGGLTRAAAQAVVGVSLPLLASLADKSLLTVDARGRFGMHPVVALFASERLAADPGREQTLRDRHAEHFARSLAAVAPHGRGDQRLLMQAVDEEFANCRGAWQHALDAQRLDWIGAMAPTWRFFYENRGRLAEGMAHFRAALALPERGAAALGAQTRLRYGLSTLLYRAGDLPQALATAQDALASAQASGEREALKGCLGIIGLSLWNTGESARALDPFERALALCEEDGDRYGMASALSHIAIARKALGEFAPALALSERALAIEREIGNTRGVAIKLNNIGNLHRALGQWHDARRFFEDGLRWCREHQLTFALPFLELNLGLTLTELGDLDAAATHLQRALDDTHKAGQLQGELAAELGLARVEILRGGPQTAEALPRLHRVVEIARARAFNTHPLQAAAIYGEWLAARGEFLAAARVWLMAIRHPTLDEQDRIGTARLLEALPLDSAQRSQAEGDVPPYAAVMNDIARAAAEARTAHT